ncbi:MAG TPA: diguanylate cyclase [Burkholderiales bacterium]|nr:diguanylate cyclase [Burkholderiales bacterium]
MTSMRPYPKRSRSCATCLALLTACLAGMFPMTASAAARGAPEPLVITSGVGSYALSPMLDFLEDPGKRLSIGDVAAPAVAGRFQRAAVSGAEINFGYSRSAYWLRLQLRVSPGAARQWLLEIAYSSLDRVEVYTPRAGGGFSVQVAGDLQPFAERPFPHRNLVFPLTLTGEADQTIYMKVVSAGNLTIPATLWQPAAMHYHDQLSYAVLSIYYGLLLALLLYNLLLFFAVRDRAFLAYVAFVATMAVAQASWNGFGNQFLWPHWPAWGNIALPSGMAAAAFFGTLFARTFLDTHRHYPRLDRVLVAQMAVFAVATFLPVVASYYVGAITVSVAGLVGAAVLTCSGIYCVAKRQPGARYFLLAWTVLLLGVAVLALRNLGWLPTNALTFYSMQIGSAAEMLLLAIALADRIQTVRLDKERAIKELLAAKQAAVGALLRSGQALESRVAARTSELAQANANLRQRERELKHLEQQDPLTGFANRSLLDDLIGHAVLRAQRTGHSFAGLGIDVDGFKNINGLHGRSVGDRMLKTIAARLRESVRQADTVARLSDDEFFVILEDLVDREIAIRIAGTIVSSLSEPVLVDSLTLQAAVSVGVAYFPDHANNPGQLMRGVEMAVYAAKSAGRNCWRVAPGPDTIPTSR